MTLDLTGPPPAVILAGGLARRMGGGDKGLSALGASTLIGHVIDRLAPQCGALALNANDDPARFAGLGLPVLADDMADRPGPLAGVLAGLDWAAGHGVSHIVTAAADTPFLPCDLVPRLLLAAETAGAELALAATGDRAAPDLHPVFGLWPVAARDVLRAALAAGQRRVADWAMGQGAAVAVFPRAEEFFNVNTPEDLAAARAMV
ncbi:molybdenum cofactor guanylyltransferase MobA [Mesobaculum littorinae]|uniref:Molybdenum cofactor guanylyltransferase n=1 Tax=Mesobaculum littorinae TaxID=2486419 RepID=A0A438AGJ2_9RHOB|nr:molybdenum cofactor guanylyltransferase MobA [Mesobaculum littorinae]RVV97814.1 molybdenum cofactor guanylyltransferase MobA [Mesobaculum littorinae]